MSDRYFSQLNYTLANEDTALEHTLVTERRPRRALSVCGSGARALPLLAGVGEELVCADLSRPQLLLADLRRATIAALDHQDFLKYWGFPPFQPEQHRTWREHTFTDLPLAAETRQAFAPLHRALGWTGLLYQGKWERTFTGVPRLLRRAIGTRYDEIFEFTDLARQRAYFRQALRTLRWTCLPALVLRLFGNAAFFNTLLYKGHFARKNVPESHYDYYRHAYRALFFQGLCRENFFLQLSFLGRLLHPEGNPLEAHATVFAQMQACLSRARLTFVNQDLLVIAEQAVQPESKYDFVSFSDVPSYFSASLGRVYLQRLARGLRAGALVVVRCYLHVPERTDTTGFVDVTERHASLVAAEKTQIYRTFIFEYRG